MRTLDSELYEYFKGLPDEDLEKFENNSYIEWCGRIPTIRKYV